jgi:hypothetical protein
MIISNELLNCMSLIYVSTVFLTLYIGISLFKGKIAFEDLIELFPPSILVFIFLIGCSIIIFIEMGLSLVALYLINYNLYTDNIAILIRWLKYGIPTLFIIVFEGLIVIEVYQYGKANKQNQINKKIKI